MMILDAAALYILLGACMADGGDVAVVRFQFADSNRRVVIEDCRCWMDESMRVLYRNGYGVEYAYGMQSGAKCYAVLGDRRGR